MRAFTVSLLCLLLPAVLRADVVETFAKPSGWFVYKGQERGATATAVPAPSSTGQCERLAWNAEHYRYLELHNERPLALPPLTRQVDGTVSVRIYAAEPDQVRHVALRLIDAKDEVFQWSPDADLPAGQWTTIRYRVRPDNFRDSWGPKKDGKIKLPVRLLGFAVDFDNDSHRAGSLCFADIECTGPGRMTEAVVRRWQFNSDEKWYISGGNAAGATVAQTESGLLLTCPAATKETGVPLCEHGFALQPLGDVTAVRLQVELLEGSGASFTIRLRDANDEVFQFTPRELHDGMNHLSWRVPEDKRDSWGDHKNGVIDAPEWAHEIWFGRSANGPEVKCRLISGEVVAWQRALESVKVDVDTGNPIHVLTPGQESKLALRLTNTAETPLALHAQVRLEDFAGRTIDVEQSLDLQPRRDVVWKLPKAPARLGIWWVHYTLIDDSDGTSLDGQRSFAYMQPAGPTPGRATGFLFSICTHTERWPQHDRELEVMAAGICGAKVIRTGAGWESVEPQSGVWKWDLLDEIVNSYARQGMEIQYLLGFTPHWAAPEKDRNDNWLVWSRKQPDLLAWRQYVSTITRRYQDRIRYWEVWNEPDIGFWKGTLDEYLQLLQAAYEETKKVNPSLQVMTGGFASYDRNPSFVEGVVQRGQQWFDILAWHRHGPFDGFQHEVDGPLAKLRSELHPPKPLYFNETAIASVGIGERAQAETLFKKLTFAWARGAIGYTWYDLRNDGFSPTDYEHNYGMLTNDFYPKAVYVAYNTIVATLQGKQFAEQLDLGAQRWGFVYNDDAETVIAAWSDVPGGADEHLVLKTDAASAEQVDLMGNRTTVPIAAGRVALVVSRHPGFLILHHARKKPEVAGA